MKDRIPTKVVNGALRMEQVDENGNHVGYVYLKRADDPTVDGTPFSVQTMLKDDTATSLGLSVANDPTPNDAFAKTAQLLEDLRGRVASVESAIPFAATVFTASGTFTASENGYYRITAIGAGGKGGTARTVGDLTVYNYSGGGGGSGAICVFSMEMTAGATLTVEIADYASVVGYCKAGAGGKGGAPVILSISKTNGKGGTGGTAETLTSAQSVYLINGLTGTDGQTTISSNVNWNTPKIAGRGGSVPYSLPGHAVNNEYSGVGFLVGYNFGYGGRGGYGGFTLTPPEDGGSAGVVIEYLGTAEATIPTEGVISSLDSIIAQQEEYIGGATE